MYKCACVICPRLSVLVCVHAWMCVAPRIIGPRMFLTYHQVSATTGRPNTRTLRAELTGKLQTTTKNTTKTSLRSAFYKIQNTNARALSARSKTEYFPVDIYIYNIYCVYYIHVDGKTAPIDSSSWMCVLPRVHLCVSVFRVVV